MRKKLLPMLATVFAMAITPALAGFGDPINSNEQGVAIHGYDPVAYFVVGAPTLGSDQFTASYQGATFHFASAANRDLFKAAPEKYAPQFGGYCALGVGLDHKVDIDPTQWHIVDGKLYINSNEKTDARWQRDMDKMIEQGHGYWQTLASKPAPAPAPAPVPAQ